MTNTNTDTQLQVSTDFFRSWTSAKQAGVASFILSSHESYHMWPDKQKTFPMIE